MFRNISLRRFAGLGAAIVMATGTLGTPAQADPAMPYLCDAGYDLGRAHLQQLTGLHTVVVHGMHAVSSIPDATAGLMAFGPPINYYPMAIRLSVENQLILEPAGLAPITLRDAQGVGMVE